MHLRAVMRLFWSQHRETKCVPRVMSDHELCKRGIADVSGNTWTIRNLRQVEKKVAVGRGGILATPVYTRVNDVANFSRISWNRLAQSFVPS